MAVQFTLWDYWGELLLLMLGSLILYLLIAVGLSRILLKKTKRIGAALLPLLLIIPVMGALFTYVLPAGERTECLYPEERAYTHTTAGTITAVRDAGHIPLYFYDGAFRGGALVTIDGTEYYALAHPALKTGVSLHFTYCPDEDLIMAFTPIGADEVEALQTPFVPPEPEPEEPVPQPQRTIGTILNGIGLLGLLAAVFVQRHFSGKLAGLLQSRDRQQRCEVVPNPAALVLLAAWLVPFCLLVFGDMLASGSFDVLFILFLGISLMLFMTWFSRAHIRIEGRRIYIRQFGKERTASLSSLRSVYWESTRHPFSQRQLVLLFDDGPLRLDQESHLGLENLHRRLSVYLNTTN